MSKKGGDVHDDTRGLRAETTSYDLPCNVCALCGTFDNLSLCAGCRGAWYCSKNHQRTHWHEHSSICHHNRSNGGKTRQQTKVKPAKKSSQTTEHTPSAGDSVTDTADDSRSTHVMGKDTSRPTCVNPPTVIGSEGGNITLQETQQTCTVDHHKVKDGIYPGPSPSVNDDIIPHSVPKEEGKRVEKATDRHQEAQQTCTVDHHKVKDGISAGPSSSVNDAIIDPSHSERNEEGKTVDEETDSSNKVFNIQGNEPDTKSKDVIPKQSKKRPKKRGKRSLASKSEDSGDKTTEDAPNPKTFQAHTMREIEDGVATSKSKGGTQPASSDSNEIQLVDYVMRSLNNYGLCVVDNFLGEKKSSQILEEVLCLYKDSSMFCEGQVVHTTDGVEKVRGDKITWIDGNEPGCSSIKSLISRIDGLIISCRNHRPIKDKEISGRTKAMVACYPGQGTCYKRHVDNPNGDGRCLTVIYYINRNWDVKSHGGLLRIFPQNFQQVADIEPKLDRLLLFWSDRRNPHEVHPSFRTRFAITIWYFDKDERKEALQKGQC